MFDPEKDITRPNVAVAPDYIVDNSGAIERISSHGGSQGLQNSRPLSQSTTVPPLSSTPQSHLFTSAVRHGEADPADPAAGRSANYFDHRGEAANGYTHGPDAEIGNVAARSAGDA